MNRDQDELLEPGFDFGGPWETHEHSLSSGNLTVLAGDTIALWSDSNPCPDTRCSCELQIAPNRPVIIGRAEGHDVPYLDPAYRPTRLMPGTGESILRERGAGADRRVSRGHFMLRAAHGGILLVNGVPRRGGGIRPPLNGTWLVAPLRRPLTPEEEYLVSSGSAIVVWLPNGAELQIDAA